MLNLYGMFHMQTNKTIKQSTRENKTPRTSCDVCKRVICLEYTELSLNWILQKKRILQYKYKHCRYEVVEILQKAIKNNNRALTRKNK